jgi:hypothetical protein
MGLIVLRSIFILASSGLAFFVITSGLVSEDYSWGPWAVFLGFLGMSAAVITLDMAVPRKQLETISAVYFGMVVGLFFAYVAGLALDP